MFRYVVLALLFCGSLAVIAESDTQARFDNYRVYSFEVDNEKQLETLLDIENHPDGLMYLEAPILGGEAELLVPPHKVPDVIDMFDSLNLKAKLKTKNIQQFIDAEKIRSYRTGYDWTRYQTITEIYEWLDEVLEQHPTILTNYTIGKSYEGRPIRAIKLSHKSGNPTIFIESLIHAREWITVATTTYLLNELLTSKDPAIVDLARNIDWVFVPILNIDGYAYTHEHNRFWRKTRQPHNQVCVGADPNRNFDAQYGGNGSSVNPCSESYRGPGPFSEPEVKALAEFISTFDNVKLYLAFHSYGQYILYPYGHTKNPSPNHQNLTQVASKTAAAIEQRFGTDYVVGTTAGTLYLATGTSVDWAYSKRNISLSYTIELRDRRRGPTGFILPPQEIIPNCLEIMDGLKVMIKEARALNQL